MKRREKPIFSLISRNAIIGLLGGATAGAVYAQLAPNVSMFKGVLLGVIFGLSAGLVAAGLEQLRPGKNHS